MCATLSLPCSQEIVEPLFGAKLTESEKKAIGMRVLQVCKGRN
jgi:hypothetical protein